jgi:hypothetical protein
VTERRATVGERALCVGCWEWREYPVCRTVWLSELDCVLCADCEGRGGPRVERVLELEERLAVRLRGERL